MYAKSVARVYLADELTNWGLTLAEAGRRAEAERAFIEATGADRDDAGAKDALARLLASRPDLPPHDPARAVALAEAAGAEAGFWNTLGVARARRGDCPVQPR